MTTLQPRLVRADTLDLQSHSAPSAQDHTRSPTFTPFPNGSAAPHHREALRNAEETAYNDRKSSPRLSSDESHNNINHAHQYDSTDDDDGDDEHSDTRNGSAHNEGDYDEGNDENDDDLDDDLLDKISSSPSIEDGKYPYFLWPPRIDSIGTEAFLASSTLPIRGIFPIGPRPFPVYPKLKENIEEHQVGHRLSDFVEEKLYHEPPQLDNHTNLSSGASNSNDSDSKDVDLDMSINLQFESSVDRADLNNFSFPANDCCFGDDGVDAPLNYEHSDWVDEGEPWYTDEFSSDDDPDDFLFSEDSRFVDSGWGGECLREVEDIDFEFVYALHTFVATVEGQANATKGDTMVLLDDSNSYWWLVRVVKDGSIGYLPAEHIETPNERLARLNKHRNIDLSASMLGDNPEKSKNPLKKAMRRRNAKTVAFTAPTYYEPSEYDFDSDDEDEGGITEGVLESQHQSSQQADTSTDQESPESVEAQDSIVLVNGTTKLSGDSQVSADTPSSPIKTEAPEMQSSQLQPSEAMQRSRNGVVRNTDSFFKDDTVETKKISLTPRLLRNDTDSTANTDQDLRSKTSADTFDKMLGSDDKTKEKEKEKKKEKRGVLSGLFKRKSSKSSRSDAEDEKGDDTGRAPQTKESLEAVSGQQSPDKKPGKLQKQQTTSGGSSKTSSVEAKYGSAQTSSTKSPIHSPNASETAISTSGLKISAQGTQTAPTEIQQDPPPVKPQPHTEKRSIFAPITTVLKSSPTHGADHESSVKTVYSKRAKERFAIDGSDSEDDHTPTLSQVSQAQRGGSPTADAQLQQSRADSGMANSLDTSDTESNDLYGPQSTAHTTNKLANLQHGPIDDVHGTPQSDTASTSKPSPSLATHTPSTSRSTPTWSDASLRSYMENDQDIRDLLIIVHDKSNVTPVGPDHPLMGGLFMTERTRLAEMQTQLDSMLTTWISKKNPGLLSR